MSKIYILVLLLTAITGYSSMVDDCKVYKSDPNTIDCTNRNLTYIPLDEINHLNAIVLNFGNNYLKFSTDDVANLSRYPYRNTVLKIILINNCIEDMPNFCDALPNVKTIDLRHNYIRSLNKEQFLCYKNLREVLLGNKPLDDTEFKNLKTELPHINFASPKPSIKDGDLSVNRCGIITTNTSNDTVLTTTTPFTVANTRKGSAKTSKTTNSTSEETPTTKQSDTFLSSNSSKTTEENDTEKMTTPVENHVTALNAREKSEKTTKSLDFTNRNLTSISIDEEYLFNASVLDYGNNYLKFSSDDVSQFYNYPYRNTVLKIILINNCIEDMPNFCNALPNVKTIDLRHNYIRSLKKQQFLCYKNLREVLLGNNTLDDTEFKNLKTELPHINFASPKLSIKDGDLSVNRCGIITTNTSNDTVLTTTTPFTVANTRKGSAKTSKTTNSTSEETPTTKQSDTFLSSNSSKTTEENDTEKMTTPVENHVTALNAREKSEKTTKSLDFTNRNLTSISIDEEYLFNASVLDYGNNYLKFSSDDVSQFYNYPYRNTVLKIILINNCIEDMPNFCDALPNVKTIDLRHNYIRSLKKKQFLCYKNLREVLLGNNPLDDTEFKNLKTELPHINFASPKPSIKDGDLSVNRCGIITTNTSNDTVLTTTTPFTVENTRKGSAKTSKTTNSTSEETPTTKQSDTFLSSNSSKTTEENDTEKMTTPVENHVTALNAREKSEKTTKSPNSVSEETPTTKSPSLSTFDNNSSKTPEENDNTSLLIPCTVLGGVVFLCIISYIIYRKRKESKKKKELEGIENQKNLTSREPLLKYNIFSKLENKFPHAFARVTREPSGEANNMGE